MKPTEKRTAVRRLPPSLRTDQGRFFAQVDGGKIGEDGRCFWPTKGEAQSAADRFLKRKIEIESNEKDRH